MLISLPINVNNKSTNMVFQVINKNDTIIVSPYNNNNINNNNNLHHIILYSKLYGINVIPIHFPLILHKKNNILISELHFVFFTMSTDNDFCTKLINGINKYYNTNYSLFDNTINILNLKLNHMNDDGVYTSVDNMINRIFYRTNKYLNFCLTIMAFNNNYIISPNSKISFIISAIKMMKCNYYGNNITIEEHIENIKNKTLVKENRLYYFTSKNNNKILKLHINSIKGNTIYCDNIKVCSHDYTITSYPSQFINIITIEKLISYLVLHYYNVMIELVANIIYNKKPFINLITSIYKKSRCTSSYQSSYHINDNMIILQEIKHLIHSVEEKYIDYTTTIPNDISFEKFSELINIIPYDIKILEKLSNFYTYPLNYDKRTLNPTFAKMLLVSFRYYNNIILNDNLNTDINFINIKIKGIFVYIVKLYKMLCEDNIKSFYNIRIYTDNMIYCIIKILLFNDTFNLFNISNKFSKTTLVKAKTIFIESTIILNILNNITWRTISKQLPCFKYVVDMKNQYSDLFIVDNKINKNISMDYKIKKLIIEPLHMFNYLKKESDYYKWIINFKYNISKIFYNPIILKDNDYYKLSKILFLFSKTSIQNIENTEYKKLINILQKNIHIILYNDRINIKIKDIFINNNLNFGFLAKHINDENITNSITITDDTYIMTNDILTFKLNKITKKYYKYKGKYFESKQNELLNSYNKN